MNKQLWKLAQHCFLGGTGAPSINKNLRMENLQTHASLPTGPFELDCNLHR